MDKTAFYTTVENQVRGDGSRGLLYDHFDDESRALSKFYTICAAAAISEIPYHAAFLIYDDGRMMQRIFDRRAEGVPEPEIV